MPDNIGLFSYKTTVNKENVNNNPTAHGHFYSYQLFISRINTLKSDFQIGMVGWNYFLVYLSKDSFDKPSTTAVTVIAISFPGVS